MHRGLKSANILTEDPELQPLASDPAFQRVAARFGDFADNPQFILTEDL